MIPVVVMAGGRGTRLHPLTSDKPKPLFNVGGRPILGQIIDSFCAQGFKSIWISVNYRADLIENYFGNGHGQDRKIKYLHEKEAMGTCGGLSTFPTKDQPVIVMNGDILTKVDFGKLVQSHVTSGAEATICLALHQHQVPYGVAEFDGENQLTGIREKPIENFLVNAGIYVLEPSLIKKLGPEPTDMPDLIAKSVKLNYFPLENAWFDCGSFIDLARANNEWSPSRE